MPSHERAGDLPVVVALGSVDQGLVSGVLDGHCRFVATPGDGELAVAEGAIARADARVDQVLLGRAPALRVIARTGVGTDLIDVPAATARGVAVVVTPGAGAAAVAEGAIGMALHLVKRFGPLTAMVRDGRWAERAGVSVGDLDGATLGVIGFGRIGRRPRLAAPASWPTIRWRAPPTPPSGGRCASPAPRGRRVVTSTSAERADRAPGRRRFPGPASRARPSAAPRRARRHRRRVAGRDGRLSGSPDVLTPSRPDARCTATPISSSPHLMGAEFRPPRTTAAAPAAPDALRREPQAVADPAWRTSTKGIR
jgi:D-3-phosphoglycerate dehydrogenase